MILCDEMLDFGLFLHKFKCTFEGASYDNFQILKTHAKSMRKKCFRSLEPIGMCLSESVVHVICENGSLYKRIVYLNEGIDTETA